MVKKSLAIVVMMTLSTPVLAASGGVQGDTLVQAGAAGAASTQTRPLKAFKSTSGSNVLKKSERQKCLDMMLPQDGVDCLAKLKAKNK